MIDCQYNMVELKDHHVGLLRECWRRQVYELDRDFTPYAGSKVEQIVNWCENAVLVGRSNCMWAVIGRDGRECPCAIVELTDARYGKDPSFKFLNVFLEPKLILDYKPEVRQIDLAQITTVLGFSFGQSLLVAAKNGVKKLKIFGCSDEMRHLFDNVIMALQPEQGIRACRQGAWLVIESSR